MKYITTFTALACVASFSLAHAADNSLWMTDFEAAKKKAAEEDKALLVDFTGSDWCGWCIRLDKEVFQHDEFKNGVDDTLVLVELDFPRDKSGQSKEVQEQNQALQEKYGVSGFPTILLTDAEGKPFARTGYREGGPDAYVEHLNELLADLKKRDAALAKAAGLEGTEKAKALAAALQALSVEKHHISTFYNDTIEQIKTLDPNDESGYVASIEAEQKFADFEADLGALAQKQKHSEMIQLADDAIDSGDFSGEMLQQVVMIKGAIHAHTGNFEDAQTTLVEAKKVAPDSRMVGRIDQMIGQIEKELANDKPEASTPQG